MNWPRASRSEVTYIGLIKMVVQIITHLWGNFSITPKDIVGSSEIRIADGM